MVIVLNTSVAGQDFAYAAGEEVDAPDDRALDLIRAGYAKATQRQAGTKQAAVNSNEGAEYRKPGRKSKH